jgi:hypothetical protein
MNEELRSKFQIQRDLPARHAFRGRDVGLRGGMIVEFAAADNTKRPRLGFHDGRTSRSLRHEA